MRTPGEQLTDMREYKGLSTQDFASKLGISEVELGEIERDKREMSEKVRARMRMLTDGWEAFCAAHVDSIRGVSWFDHIVHPEWLGERKGAYVIQDGELRLEQFHPGYGRAYLGWIDGEPVWDLEYEGMYAVRREELQALYDYMTQRPVWSHHASVYVREVTRVEFERAMASMAARLREWLWRKG